jgi:hypothetical protein
MGKGAGLKRVCRFGSVTSKSGHHVACPSGAQLCPNDLTSPSLRLDADATERDLQIGSVVQRTRTSELDLREPQRPNVNLESLAGRTRQVRRRSTTAKQKAG